MTSTTVAVRPPASNYSDRDPVAIALGEILGILPTSAHQILVGQMRHKVAAVALAFARADCPDRWLRWKQPIAMAEMEFAEEELTAELIQLGQAKDDAENGAKTAYLTDPTPETLAAWIRCQDAQASSTLRVRAAAQRTLRRVIEEKHGVAA